MHRWEHRLSLRDTNRVTLPFEWGFEFLNHGFRPSDDPNESMARFNKTMIAESDEFFRHEPLQDYHFDGDRLSFPSSVRSPYPVNNTVYCTYFRPKQKTDRAIVVLPQWNADSQGHVGLCRMLARLGYGVLRLTLPYHEERNPHGPRADFMVSPNVGRTIQAIQQSVQDARRAADWLFGQGYSRVGIMGSSVGSCISYLAFLHDERLQVGVFNHVSSYFGGVVWKGISTRHVRKGLEGMISEQDLHRAWAIISPNTHVGRLRNQTPRRMLFISARYDLTFPPDLSQLIFDEHDRQEIAYDTAYLPCGHYTSAHTPFKHLDGYHIGRYFRKHL
jgi:dienelactone hydrolase